MKPRIQEDNFKTLCTSCQWGHVIRGHNGEIVIRCQEIGGKAGRMRFAVHSCTEYEDRSQPKLRDYENMAWLLRTDSLRKKVGFVAPGTGEHRKILAETD